jgi:hypothetical protein
LGFWISLEIYKQKIKLKKRKKGEKKKEPKKVLKFGTM